MSAAALSRAQRLLGDAVLSTSSFRGDDTLVVKAEKIASVLKTLRDDNDLAMDFLVDLTAVDRFALGLKDGEARFEVVYHLRSMKSGARLRVKAPLQDVLTADGGVDPLSAPELDSVVPLWPGANWYEREVYDMFGIHFRGHPDPRRILLYEEFIGYPLRKDYPKERRHPLVRRDGSEV